MDSDGLAAFNIRWYTCSMVSTTNGLERQFETLKYRDLDDLSNRSLTDLLTAVVLHFVPMSERM